MFHWAAPSEASSVVGAPVAVIAGHQAASDEQNQVHKPPDAQASQGEQLPDSGARVAQAEAVDPKAAKEEGVQQRGDEVVSSVSARKQEAGGGSMSFNLGNTFDIWTCWFCTGAKHRGPLSICK